MADGVRVRSIVKFLSDEHSQEREEAFSLFYELSKSEALCEKIGSVNGAILILVGMTDNKSENISIVEKADKILKNLEKNENNVRQMAENGRLQPFLTLLLQGITSMKLYFLISVVCEHIYSLYYININTLYIICHSIIFRFP